MGLVIGDSLLFYSIHPCSFDVSVFVVYYSIPNFTILVFPHVFSVFVIFFYVPHFPNLVFPHIFVTTRKSECSITHSFSPFFHSPTYFLPSGKVIIPRPFGFLFSTSPLYWGWMSLSPKFSQFYTRRSFPPVKDFSIMRITKTVGK